MVPAGCPQWIACLDRSDAGIHPIRMQKYPNERVTPQRHGHYHLLFRFMGLFSRQTDKPHAGVLLHNARRYGQRGVILIQIYIYVFIRLKFNLSQKKIFYN